LIEVIRSVDGVKNVDITTLIAYPESGTSIDVLAQQYKRYSPVAGYMRESETYPFTGISYVVW
jgi:hypothetical protein